MTRMPPRDAPSAAAGLRPTVRSEGGTLPKATPNAEPTPAPKYAPPSAPARATVDSDFSTKPGPAGVKVNSLGSLSRKDIARRDQGFAEVADNPGSLRPVAASLAQTAKEMGEIPGVAPGDGKVNAMEYVLAHTALQEIANGTLEATPAEREQAKSILENTNFNRLEEQLRAAVSEHDTASRIDQHGNGDGVITREEAEAYRAHVERSRVTTPGSAGAAEIEAADKLIKGAITDAENQRVKDAFARQRGSLDMSGTKPADDQILRTVHLTGRREGATHLGHVLKSDPSKMVVERLTHGFAPTPPLYSKPIASE